MEPKYNIVFTGRFAEGTTRESALQQFSARFQVSAGEATAMLPENGISILKRDVDQASVEKFKRMLDEIGVLVEIRPASPPPEETAVAPDNHQDEVSAEQVQDARSFNPYQRAAPRRQQSASGEERSTPPPSGSILNQKVFEGASSVPASRGIKWITEGYSNHVRKDLGPWIGAVLLYFVFSLVMGLIPVIGSFVLLLVAPIVIAGFMIGAREQEEGGSFSIGHLLSGFNESPGQLVLIAVFYFIGVLLAAFLTFFLFGMSFPAVANPESATPQELMAVLMPALLMMLFILPLLMAYWFAPALVALEGLTAFEAMKQSFKGCLLNVLPMLLYSLLGLVLLFVAAIPLMLGLILLLPVLVASIYVSYRDIFRSRETVFTP